ncbi:MAG: DUF4392 domain-containing protein [Theionarchaea archaeon]|nr:DUF4392 domain-containing protein [Theionarchaea archaeon]
MIEDIILKYDTRGMNDLRNELPVDFCRQAAEFLRGHMDTVLMTTGFYVSGCCETDGPPGAIMLGEALMELGSNVKVVTDRYCYEVLKMAQVPFDVYEFPVAGEKESRAYGEELLSQIDPTVLVSIERCGRATDGGYYNMKAQDISQYTAKIDVLFDFPWSVGVGDGGNEIGMGKVHDRIRDVVVHGDIIGSVVETTHLVVSSVSNWGVYGLLAYLSMQEERLFLKSEDKILSALVKAGAIDSTSRSHVLAVDGFSLQTTHEIIDSLEEESGL